MGGRGKKSFLHCREMNRVHVYSYFICMTTPDDVPKQYSRPRYLRDLE